MDSFAELFHIFLASHESRLECCSVFFFFFLKYVLGVLGVWERWGGDGFFAAARDSRESNSRYAIVDWSLKSHY